ncbi:MAG: YciI family protein [Anaerolineales bacterium]|nr:YciI family protein [Anaerolineales bacterium]
MRYMMLVYGEEFDLEDFPPEVLKASLAQFNAFHEEMARRGAMLAADRLQPSGTATTVKVRDGRVLTTDGPFADTKEQLGGIYVFEAQDLDEALEIAAKIPAAAAGSIEVRPIMEVAVEEGLAAE